MCFGHNTAAGVMYALVRLTFPGGKSGCRSAQYSFMEAPMRLATFCFSFALAQIGLMPLPVFAQQTPGPNGAAPSPPGTAVPPPPPYLPSAVGVAPPESHPPITVANPEQEVPLAPVKAAPCTPYARETDGSTTCIGIPSTMVGGRHRR